jgi:DNA-directed RNA polymerase subunit RPC12/RpoP
MPPKASFRSTTIADRPIEAAATTDNKKKRAPPKPEEEEEQQQILLTDADPSSTTSKNDNVGRKRKKSTTSDQDVPVKTVPVNAIPNPPAATGNGKKSTKQPKTLREKILHVLSTEDQLVSLIKLKKRLAESYEIEETTANNNKINKLLKTLQDEEGREAYFGKIGGSYHGGIHSPAYQAWKQADDERQAKEAEDKAHEDDINCPFCGQWNDCMATWKGEDSIARGGRYRCDHCGKAFWSWISDGYRYGHEVEYKKSGMNF